MMRVSSRGSPSGSDPSPVAPVIVAAGSALFALPGVGGTYWRTVLVAGASYMEAA